MNLKMPKKKSIIKVICFCTAICVFTGLLLFLINGYVKTSVSDLILSCENLPDNSSYDCILVLGCGVSPDGVPSAMLVDRLKKAVELYHAGAAPKIIMSGDHERKDYDEVNTMRSYAIECGVPKEDIFMDHAGFSTYESVYRAKDVFCAEKIIVVTQQYHLYRALYISEKLGLDAVGVNADLRRYYGQSMRDLREVAARCKDFFKCIYKPEPTFLGEAIPVSGDGTATVD